MAKASLSPDILVLQWHNISYPDDLHGESALTPQQAFANLESRIAAPWSVNYRDDGHSVVLDRWHQGA
jgi:hypothetical protein